MFVLNATKLHQEAGVTSEENMDFKKCDNFMIKGVSVDTHGVAQTLIHSRKRRETLRVETFEPVLHDAAKAE
jgi:hypothetical protein